MCGICNRSPESAPKGSSAQACPSAPGGIQKQHEHQKPQKRHASHAYTRKPSTPHPTNALDQVMRKTWSACTKAADQPGQWRANKPAHCRRSSTWKGPSSPCSSISDLGIKTTLGALIFHNHSKYFVNNENRVPRSKKLRTIYIWTLRPGRRRWLPPALQLWDRCAFTYSSCVSVAKRSQEKESASSCSAPHLFDDVLEVQDLDLELLARECTVPCLQHILDKAHRSCAHRWR